jgi:hypothetical protein
MGTALKIVPKVQQIDMPEGALFMDVAWIVLDFRGEGNASNVERPTQTND